MLSRVSILFSVLLAVMLVPVGSAFAQSQVCARLERELARLTSLQGSGRGNPQDGGYADAFNRQQQNIGVMKRQMTRGGCAPDVYVALRQGGQCASMAQHLAAMEDNLQSLQSRMSRMRGRDYSGQIRGLQIELQRNRCSERAEPTRVRTAPEFSRYPNDVTRDSRYPNDATRQDEYREPRRGPGLFNNFWGGDRLSREQMEAIDRAKRGYHGGSGTVRTICVRTCDGFYFPISFSTVRSNLEEDASKCQAQCPGTEAKLFFHSNPGEDPEFSTALDGTRYTDLTNASRYQREFVNGCSCNTPQMMAGYANMSPRAGQPVELSLEQKLAALNNAPLPPRRGEAGERELVEAVKGGADKKVRVILSYPPIDKKPWDAQLAAGARPVPDREPAL